MTALLPYNFGTNVLWLQTIQTEFEYSEEVKFIPLIYDRHTEPSHLTERLHPLTTPTGTSGVCVEAATSNLSRHKIHMVQIALVFCRLHAISKDWIKITEQHMWYYIMSLNISAPE